MYVCVHVCGHNVQRADFVHVLYVQKVDLQPRADTLDPPHVGFGFSFIPEDIQYRLSYLRVKSYIRGPS